MDSLATERLHTNFAWLLRLRWGAVLSQLATVFVAAFGFGLALDLRGLLSVVAVTVLSNALCWRLLANSARLQEWMLAGLMGLDFALLTLLLYLAGGASNPFSVLYLVHVALAAAVLPSSHAWALALLSSAAFGSLFLLPARHDAVVHAMGMHEHAATGSMGLHFQGMWVAFSIAALVIVYFVTRVSRDLDAQRAAAAEARTLALRSEKLASLATLSAGAAHELATPLSTIAVVATELARDLALTDQSPQAQADAQLIREEVERCRSILAHMANDAGETMGESFQRVATTLLFETALDTLKQRGRVHVTGVGTDEAWLPLRTVATSLRAVINNALDASDEALPVHVRVASSPHNLEILVSDRGKGMDEATLQRVGEPFFSTKEPGRGMGLGVFLARAVLERLGGSMHFDSSVGSGTRVRLVVPRAMNQEGKAV